MIQVGAPDETVVYKEILVPPCFFCCIRFAYKTGNVHIIRLLLYTHQPGIVRITQDLNDALFEGSFFKMKNFLAIGSKRKEYLRESHSNPDEFIHNMPEFCCIAFKEIASRRHIEKKILHRNACSGVKSYGLLIFNITVFDLNKHSRLFFC